MSKKTVSGRAMIFDGTDKCFRKICETLKIVDDFEFYGLQMPGKKEAHGTVWINNSLGSICAKEGDYIGTTDSGEAMVINKEYFEKNAFITRIDTINMPEDGYV